MRVDRGRRGEADCLTDLAYRRRITPLAQARRDVHENLLALVAQCLDHDHPFPSGEPPACLVMLSSAARARRELPQQDLGEHAFD